jgi:hypothetical protein
VTRIIEHCLRRAWSNAHSCYFTKLKDGNKLTMEIENKGIYRLRDLNLWDNSGECEITWLRKEIRKDTLDRSNSQRNSNRASKLSRQRLRICGSRAEGRLLKLAYPFIMIELEMSRCGPGEDGGYVMTSKRLLHIANQMLDQDWKMLNLSLKVRTNTRTFCLESFVTSHHKVQCDWTNWFDDII